MPFVFLKLFSVVTCVSSRVIVQWCSITMICTAVCFVCANRGDDQSRAFVEHCSLLAYVFYAMHVLLMPKRQSALGLPRASIDVKLF